MDTTQLLGVLVVAFSGILIGGSPWPIKVMRHYKYEHWAFVAMLAGMVVVPWAVTLLFCPNAMSAYGTVAREVLIKANLFSISAGLANALALICFTTIGISLTSGLSSGVAITIGVVTPMILKASGAFANAPSPGSAAGLTVLIGAAVMVAGVALMTIAGFGREKAMTRAGHRPKSFLVGVILCVLAGILSLGFTFSFAYCQDPIVKVMQAQGASNVAANSAVWAVGLFAAGLINVLYPAFLMTKSRSWGILAQHPGELMLAILYGLLQAVGFICMGKGMLLLGALGASVGYGLQQSFQISTMQAVGFIGGEWKGVRGRSRHFMYAAITVLLVAAAILAYGNKLAQR